MNIDALRANAEAILYSVGDMVTAKEIADALEITVDEAHKILRAMMDEWKAENRGIQIIEIGDGYQMSSSPECYPAIRKLLEPRKKQGLSGASLEALSIVAYNQPVTKSTVEYIRGVDCSYVMNKLLERGFIEEAGRLDGPGKPILYRTTTEFLRCFGLRSVEDLPELENPLMEDDSPEQLMLETEPKDSLPDQITFENA